MDSESRLVHAYLHSSFALPGALVRAVIAAYVTGFHHFDRLTGRQCRTAEEAEDIIAESSERLMQVHYDMPRVLFENMLGPTMKYSMGLWSRGACNLEQAQEAMLDDLCAKATIGGSQRILDIGCGFGSFCAHVLERYPEVAVTGLTLSRTQADYIREKQTEPGHPLNTPRFKIVQANFAEWGTQEKFDRVVSIGVMEHIASLRAANAKIAGLLEPGGQVFHHYIVYKPHEDDQTEPRQNAFIDRYVFPGGRNRAYPGQIEHPEPFELRGDWFFDGGNYRRTLLAWLANFRRNRAVIEATGIDAATLKLWEIYLCGCVSTFGLEGCNHYGNGQYLLAKSA